MPLCSTMCELFIMFFFSYVTQIVVVKNCLKKGRGQKPVVVTTFVSAAHRETLKSPTRLTCCVGYTWESSRLICHRSSMTCREALSLVSKLL
jgi:hypothetical protein